MGESASINIWEMLTSNIFKENGTRAYLDTL